MFDIYKDKAQLTGVR